MHSHIFVPSTKKDICYCKICSQLSYKGKICQTLPITNYNRFNVDPLKIKFRPISAVTNYKLESHIKYLENKSKGISKIKFLTNNFGLKSMILYKSISFMNQIYLENEISIENIDSIASLCVLLVTEYNECCLPPLFEEYLTKNENDILYHSYIKKISNNNIRNNELVQIMNNNEIIKSKSNLNGLFYYIKKNVNNFKYWEILCLKYLNYDLGKYTAYDYLILFFKLGIFFCEEEINIIDKLKYCIKILDCIINDKKSCNFSQYTFAMSIIKVVLENDNFFDKKIFKYIYGVDLSKKKYINCSNLIKNILSISINIDNSKKFFNNLNNLLNYNQLNFQQIYNNKFISNFPTQQINFFNGNNLLLNERLNDNYLFKGVNIYKNNSEEEEKMPQKNNIEINNCNHNNLGNNGVIFKQFQTPIINNNHIFFNNNIINNNININNNFELNKNFVNKNFNFNNNYYFYNINNLFKNCNNNFQKQM